jgi:hypothetical protein
MGSMRSKLKRKPIESSEISWLPIDSRILPSLFAFGHVRGLAKIFLIIEMLLAGFVVTGTLLLIVLTVLV